MANKLQRLLSEYSPLRAGFVKNLFVLAAGTTAAQAISVLALPFLQRYYSPAEFGTLNLFVSLTTVIAAFSTMKLEYAIVLPRSDSEANALFRISVLSVVATAILSLPVLYFFKEPLLPDTTDPERIMLLFCVPLSVLFLGSGEALNYWFIRHENYKIIARAKVIQNTTSESYRFIHLMISSTQGLIIGRVFGQLVNAIILLKNKMTPGPHPTRDEMKKALKTYRNFPLFTMPTVFITTFTSYIFAYLFISYYGKTTTGLVAVANQYISLPLGIIASSFSQVFYKRISLIEDKQSLLSLYLRFSGRLFLISILMTAVVMIIPDHWPDLLVGEAWSGLMPYVRLTIAWQAISFVSSSLSFIYTRLMLQKIMFFFGAAQLIIVFVTITMGHEQGGDPLTTFSYYVAGQGVYYVFTIVAAIFFIRGVRPEVLMRQP